MRCLSGQHILEKIGLKIVVALKGIQYFLSVQFVERGSDDSGARIALLYQLNGFLYPAVVGLVRPCQEYRACGLYLVGEKLAEVSEICLCLGAVNDSHSAVQRQLRILIGHIAHSAHHVRELSYARRFDDDALGRVFLNHLPQRGSEISDQRAAYAA